MICHVAGITPRGARLVYLHLGIGIGDGGEYSFEGYPCSTAFNVYSFTGEGLPGGEARQWNSSPDACHSVLRVALNIQLHTIDRVHIEH